jgi:precorrin-2 dehydrogenase / sirohydrochlorin ferrochelatase
MIPLFVDCSGRRIVVFGGGAVAARKAAYFAGEAQVLVVSRSFSEKMAGLPVEHKTCDVRDEPDRAVEELIAGAFLVIGALSDPGQNNRIGKICRRAGILFNNADGDEGDVRLPAITRAEHYTLAISTDGSSPAVSRYIREYLELELPALDAMIVLQERLRKKLRNLEPDQARRMAVLREVLEDASIWKHLESDPDTAWELVSRRYLHD